MKNFLIIIGFVVVSITCVKAQLFMHIGPSDSLTVVGYSIGQSGLNVVIKDSLKPDIYIDGIKYDSKILDIINPGKIESMKSIKGEAAIKEYNAPNGAILITSKAAAEKSGNPGAIRIRATNGSKDKQPKVVINGKIATQEELSKISPDMVQSIEIMDGEAASKVYKGASAAVVVTTKDLEAFIKDKLRSTDENVGRKAVFIIDGKFTDQEEFAKIPQSEVESVEYLKGEEAEAVYKGGGLVVVVKTKKLKE